MKNIVALLLLSLLLLYPFTIIQAQSTQTEKIQILINALSKEIDRLQAFITSRVTNTTKQNELLQQLSVAKALLTDASNLASAGNYNESLKVLREARTELVDVARKLVPEVISARKALVSRSLEAQIRALQSQIKAIQNLALRFQQKNVEVSNITSLLTDAQNLLNQASDKLKANDTATALQLVNQAWEKVKEAERSIFTLARELRQKNVSSDLARLQALFSNTYAKLQKTSPLIAEEFRNWSQTWLNKIQELISSGKYAEALGLIRSAMFEYHEYLVYLTKAERVANLAKTAQELATVIRPCNATLADQLLSAANALTEALKTRDKGKVIQTAQELNELILQARFACRAPAKRTRP
ncbi:MAG: hypothetical protein ABWK01_09680 [Infirmifilum sp.]